MASAFIIGFMCIFPPWNFVFASRPEVMSSQKAGYGFILTPPKPVKYVPIKPPKTGSIFEGIENERAADFCTLIDKPHIAKCYMVRAYHAYRQWGALAKCKLLEERYPYLLQLSVAEPTKNTTQINKTN